MQISSSLLQGKRERQRDNKCVCVCVLGGGGGGRGLRTKQFFAELSPASQHFKGSSDFCPQVTCTVCDYTLLYCVCMHVKIR